MPDNTRETQPRSTGGSFETASRGTTARAEPKQLTADEAAEVLAYMQEVEIKLQPGG